MYFNEVPVGAIFTDSGGSSWRKTRIECGRRQPVNPDGTLATNVISMPTTTNLHSYPLGSRLWFQGETRVTWPLPEATEKRAREESIKYLQTLLDELRLEDTPPRPAPAAAPVPATRDVLAPETVVPTNSNW